MQSFLCYQGLCRTNTLLVHADLQFKLLSLCTAFWHYHLHVRRAGGKKGGGEGERHMGCHRITLRMQYLAWLSKLHTDTL